MKTDEVTDEVTEEFHQALLGAAFLASTIMFFVGLFV